MVTVVPDSVAVEMLAVAKDFEIVGGPTTVSIAVLLVVPVPLSVALIAPVVLAFAPAVVPLTLTLTVQVPLAASEPPLKLSVVSPAAGEKVPLQVLLTPGGFATSNPDGRLSVKPIPARPVDAFGFVIVKVNVVVPLSGMLDAPNALLMVGGSTWASVHSENELTPLRLTALLTVSTAPVRPCAVQVPVIFFHSASFVSVLPFSSALR